MIYDTYEKAVKGYTKEELDFYDAFDIKPLILSECSFYNLTKYNYEVGDDCCDYTDMLLYESGCPKECTKQRELYACYPTLCNDIFVYFSFLLNSKKISICTNSVEEYKKLLLSTIVLLVNENRISEDEYFLIKQNIGHYTLNVDY